MLLRKPTTIQLKPEDDQIEYDEFKNRQDLQKKGVQINQAQQIQKTSIGNKNLLQQQQFPQFPFDSGQLNLQYPQFGQRRSFQMMTQEPVELVESGWGQQTDQVPINQLFSMFSPSVPHNPVSSPEQSQQQRNMYQ